MAAPKPEDTTVTPKPEEPVSSPSLTDFLFSKDNLSDNLSAAFDKAKGRSVMWQAVRETRQKN
jgi:hypothetical protein